MISEVVMPQMGADMTEGTILRWLKREGDAVDRGEVIAEIETDKANVEIEAFDDLDAPVARVCGADVPIPYAKELEQAALPQPDAIAQAARGLM